MSMQKQTEFAKIPEEYISLDEFRKLVHEDTENFCVKFGVIDKNDDFWEEYATAISCKELRQRMYQKIDAWNK